jgi:hypothetical protein
MSGRMRTLVDTGRLDSWSLSSDPATVGPMSGLIGQ